MYRIIECSCRKYHEEVRRSTVDPQTGPASAAAYPSNLEHDFRYGLARSLPVRRPPLKRKRRALSRPLTRRYNHSPPAILRLSEARRPPVSPRIAADFLRAKFLREAFSPFPKPVPPPT